MTPKSCVSNGYLSPFPKTLGTCIHLRVLSLDLYVFDLDLFMDPFVLIPHHGSSSFPFPTFKPRRTNPNDQSRESTSTASRAPRRSPLLRRGSRRTQTNRRRRNLATGRSHHGTMQNEVFPMRAKVLHNPRPANEFVLCLRCARWGLRAPDPDCSHVERVDLSKATQADMDEMLAIAERVVRRRNEANDCLALLGRNGKRLESLGRVRRMHEAPSPSSRIVRLMQPDPRDPRYEMTVPREGDKVRWRARISTDPANQN